MVRPAGRNDLQVQALYLPGKGNSELNGKGVVGNCESEGNRRQNAGLTNSKRIQGVMVG
jgi:hypothetical protein